MYLTSKAIQHLVDTLDMMIRWVDEVPPHAASQRFGNLAFRSYHELVGEVSARTSKLEQQI
jgi:serine/threonine-protein phosphatase 2A activator